MKGIKNNNQTAGAVRATSKHYDIKLLFPVLFLVGIGIVMVYSASSAIALKKFGVDYYFLKKQAFASLLGIIALVFFRHVPLKFIRSLTYPLLTLSLVCLTAIHISGFGFSAGGSARWLRFGSLNFQPSEFARFALVLYLAYSMSKKKDELKDFYIGFLPHVIVLGAFTALILLQPDFGSAVILWCIAWIMLFVGGVRIRHLISPLLIILPVGYFYMVNAEYRIKRIMSFWDPWQYQTDEGYQIIHSLMAFGTGGIWGTGIGKGYQKLFYLPEPHTDFIFSVIAEELGLFGVLAVIALYSLILWIGISIAIKTRDAFGSFLATGITVALGLQSCVNMGVVLGLLPTKGLTLPFLSYGGTSLLFSMASIGILMNIGAMSSKVK
ncbi:MAG: putative lipid II flippase FtsW [Deltaproteobacteria bacterium]|nr:putative lipid II flippase FtsW [Deltaproteobacteria bacterium]MBW2662197.1 putative lipid II flippase FtsW [Deltaproteobacteria bacterium]